MRSALANSSSSVWSAAALLGSSKQGTSLYNNSSSRGHMLRLLRTFSSNNNNNSINLPQGLNLFKKGGQLFPQTSARRWAGNSNTLYGYRWRMVRIVELQIRSCSTGIPEGGGSDSAEGPVHDQGVEVIYFRGLPQFTIPLPSRRERCRFIVKPLTNTVGDLLDMIRHEDKGVDRSGFFSTDGVRIASANTIEMLMEHDFTMVINDDVYSVKTPPHEKPSEEDLSRLSSVRNLVGQLYGALNIDEHQLRHEREMVMELERLKGELTPLEDKREQINELALKRTNTLTWVGLGLMSIQFGILARLTWWEYSWDIMEPVTYFVTYGTAMLAYAYFVLTKQEYVLPQVADRQYLITFHKNAKKVGLDVSKYNNLRDKIHKIETDLNRLRDPLALHLPLRTRLSSGTGNDSLGDSILNPPTSQSIVSKATQRIQQIFKKSS